MRCIGLLRWYAVWGQRSSPPPLDAGFAWLAVTWTLSVVHLYASRIDPAGILTFRLLTAVHECVPMFLDSIVDGVGRQKRD